MSSNRLDETPEATRLCEASDTGDILPEDVIQEACNMSASELESVARGVHDVMQAYGVLSADCSDEVLKPVLSNIVAHVKAEFWVSESRKESSHDEKAPHALRALGERASSLTESSSPANINRPLRLDEITFDFAGFDDRTTLFKARTIVHDEAVFNDTFAIAHLSNQKLVAILEEDLGYSAADHAIIPRMDLPDVPQREIRNPRTWRTVLSNALARGQVLLSFQLSKRDLRTSERTGIEVARQRAASSQREAEATRE